MESELSAYLQWLRGHGVAFEVARKLMRDPDKDGPRVKGDATRRSIDLPGMAPLVEHRDPEAGIASDHATHSVAWAMLRDRSLSEGKRVWDIGCGTGVLAVVAALAGARSVVATDVEPRALQLTRETAEEAGVKVRVLAGSLLDPLPDHERADLIVANLPHKPVPDDYELFIAQNGGPDGAHVHGAFAEQAARRTGASARVLFFLHSLPHPRLLQLYAGYFDLTLVSWKRRFLLPGEYGDLQEHFVDRARAGTSFLLEVDGRRVLVAGVWMGVRR